MAGGGCFPRAHVSERVFAEKEDGTYSGFAGINYFPSSLSGLSSSCKASGVAFIGEASLPDAVGVGESREEHKISPAKKEKKGKFGAA